MSTRTEIKLSPAGVYVDALLDTVCEIESNLPGMVPLAEQAAERLVAGGSLYSMEDGGGFCSEIGGRAGGIMMIKRLDDPADAGAGDVVLMGTSGLDPEGQAANVVTLMKGGALVIGFGSARSPLAEVSSGWVDNALPPGTAPLVHVGGEAICPASTTANITAVWAFIGELVGACTRLGIMPTMYQSVFIPNSKLWNPTYTKYRFHEDYDISPLAPGAVGKVFLTTVYRCLVGIRHTQLPLFEQAGRSAAGALDRGSKAWYFFSGHHLRDQYGLPGDPGLLSMGDKDDPAVGSDDVYLWVGYYDRPAENLDLVEQAGCAAVWICGARPVDPIELREDRVVIDPYWGFGDAAAAIPGYPIRILPPSGVIQTACLWMVVGEMAQALS